MAEQKEQRELDRKAELDLQQKVIDAVAARNKELAAGADPDRSLELPNPGESKRTSKGN